MRLKVVFRKAEAASSPFDKLRVRTTVGLGWRKIPIAGLSKPHPELAQNPDPELVEGRGFPSGTPFEFERSIP
jgi:hypothetical protein